MDSFSDPSAQAAELLARQDHEGALALLQAIPEGSHPTPLAHAACEVLAQKACLAWAQSTEDATLRLRLFSKNLKHFFMAVYIHPFGQEAYLVQAAFWEILGRPAQARHTLRSIARLVPDPPVLARLEALADAAEDRPAPPASVAEIPKVAMRLLVLVIPDYDPGLDIYVDGLRRVLGDEAVEEYPWKPALHGEDPGGADGYPLTFEHGGTPRDLPWLCTQLAAGHFDAVIYGDVLSRLPQAELDAIVQAAGDTPFFVVDGWDDCANNLPLFLPRLGKARVLGYFKREFLEGGVYDVPWEGRRIPAQPFPLSYSDGRVPADVFASPRRQALFWAGNRYYGTRRLYLEALEEGLGVSLDAKYGPEEYRTAFMHAHIGLSLCGFGFDTIRYYEAAAFGTVALAERPPIVIPHDFRSGEEGLYFRDLQELEEQLAWLMAHPARWPAMAQAGHAHFLRYHVGSARARQLLGHMANLLQDDSR